MGFLVLAAIVAAFIFLLRKPTRTVINTAEKSIAVLPFENLSEDKGNAYFAEGIQDEILTRLSKIADLKVISRTSTQHYKSAPENLPESPSILASPTSWKEVCRRAAIRARERAADQGGQ